MINRQSQKSLPYRDPFLIPIIGFLSGWGLLSIFRLSPGFGNRQAIWLISGLLVVFLMIQFPKLLESLRRFQYLWLLCGIALTMLTLFMGIYPGGNGPRLWLNFAGLYLQPSEPLKLLLIIFLSAYLADNLPLTRSLLHLILPTLILFGVALTILLIQRDLGTSTLFIIIYTSLIYFATGKKRILLISALVILLAGFAGYQLFDVIRIRVDAWINPWLDPSGRSYQIVQSLIAVAAGGIFGRGPGLGNPRLIPIAHSDFIFTAMAEEAGLMGSIGFLVLSALLFYRGIRIALNAGNQFQRFLAAGITTYYLAQGILIISGNLRLLPLTGVTLPFVSYGGSSLITNMIGFGILLLISSNPNDMPAPLYNSRPYLFVSAIAMIGLLLIAISIGWWTLIRGTTLLSRTDNFRRTINELYVRRGSILDRQSRKIVASQGISGDLKRIYFFPPLSATTGYNSQAYGQSGLEQSMDGYLRGEKGNSATDIWMSHFLYGQSPEGLDIRLSLDLQIQQLADELMAGKKGAAVLMNAESGETLVLSSHPNIDPNQVESMWSGWMIDPQAPLINRATQVNYSIGTALTPFILAAVPSEFFNSAPPSWTSLYIKDQPWFCALNPEEQLDWNSSMVAGCPQPLYQITQSMSENDFTQLISLFGFTVEPQIPLPVSPAYALPKSFDPEKIVFGADPIKVSPLQVAVAAAALTNGDHLVQPQLVTAVTSPDGWIMLPSQESVRINLPNNDEIIQRFLNDDLPIWEVNGVSYSEQGRVSWYVAGTSSEWQGTPYSFVVLLEGNYSRETRAIGRSILESIINP